MKRKLLAGSAVFGVFAYVLIAHGISIWPRASHTPSSIPTSPISRTQQTGGVAVAQKSQYTNSKSGSQPASLVAKQSLKDIHTTAPKQAEVAASMRKEYPYRALKISNDPIQQPTWVQNGLRIPTAWDITTGTGVIVADIDTGFALNHDDLKNQWYQNSGETGTTQPGDVCWTGTAADKSTNNCDDDQNGYVDDWRGWNFVDATNNPQAGLTNPTGGGVSHGTETAGLIGASGNNGVGMATVAWNNKIMPLQALDDDGSGYTSGVTAAVYYAVDNGASVINMSLGGSEDDPALATAVQYAFDHNVVIVAAAGNCGTGTEQGCDPNEPGAMGYPALNNHVIAVGATTSTGARASFSSYGPGLDVMAPGSGALVSTMWTASNQTSAYASTLYGTSFASPLVASYAGLLRSVRPNGTVDDITALIDASASKPSGMNSQVYTPQFGHGLADTTTGLVIATNENQIANPAKPTLAQTGGNLSEHTYTTSSTLSSGCTVPANAYCTVWAVDQNGFDRYLPYSQALTSQVGWNWSGSVLGSGNWSVRARSGSQVSSTPYQLFNK